MTWLTSVVMILFAFLSGSLPFSVWISRLSLGVDVRSYGDGNPGAANAFRTGNKLVGLLVLSALALTGLVDTQEALAGFSSPAVVTIWAVFILSGGLTRTGIANILGRQLLKVARRKASLLVLTIMLMAGTLSAFMNSVAVVALMLPVVMDISRKTGHPPSALLMPLAYGTLLGGATTLIATGDIVEVDGSAGVVRIIERVAKPAE